MADGHQGAQPPIPDRPPRVLTWGVVLLVLAALPQFWIAGVWTFLDSTDAARERVRDGLDPTAAFLLNIGYLALVLRIRGGRPRTRAVVAVLTVLYDMYIFVLVGVGTITGDLGTVSGGIVSAAVLLLSAAGLTLVHLTASSEYINTLAVARAARSPHGQRSVE